MPGVYGVVNERTRDTNMWSKFQGLRILKFNLPVLVTLAQASNIGYNTDLAFHRCLVVIYNKSNLPLETDVKKIDDLCGPFDELGTKI